ncbi:hypothetical protein [Pseudomonas oryzae]|uniref:Uncharacterized protein n=1 Tax=Pseudomonas oryzae TaxID=1392877 RepID=A0A1H1N7N4_9PSED|nr:hypothetical protein [Pseudomonas oryzae]SDR94735.1 hypothetical protein SAMN05216221_0720 [Pseudomonas oryzae]
MTRLAISCGAFAALLIALGAGWLYVKLSLATDTQHYMTYWNESRSCYINTYTPKFSSLGALGWIVRLFSSGSFFRVYSKDGILLKSSEWLLWQREFAESEKAIWIHGRAIYPTDSGYEEG